jgi:regulator of nucleoside diphosphate kinase
MNKIYITTTDHEKLIELLQKTKEKMTPDKVDTLLFNELKRAEIVDPEDIPPDVVTMNSRVRFTDIESGKELMFWLVFPEEADIFEGKISILSPIGSSLIGYKVGDIFEFETQSRARKLRIEEILYQPEAVGHYE